MATMTRRLRSQDKRYEITKVVDTYNDYDGGTWYHVWDNVDEVILFESDYFREAKQFFDSLQAHPLDNSDND